MSSSVLAVDVEIEPDVRHRHVVNREDVGQSALVREGVGDLVLHVAGADAVHRLALGGLAQLLDVVLGEAGHVAAVVELGLLEQGQLVEKI